MSDDGPPFWRKPWTVQAPAFAITDRLYYVGNTNVSCHLLQTARGWVLIDTAFAQTTYLLTESLRAVGCNPSELALIIHTHGHVDHCGATRRMKELSAATVAMGEGDVVTVEQATAMTCAEYLYGINDFEPFEVDRPLAHGDVIDMGDVTIECHHTPGHTPGVMTYTFTIPCAGQPASVGLFGGPGLWTLQDQHRDSQGYPGNREDFAASLHALRALEVDLWLGAHPNQNATFEKHARLAAGEAPSPFLDPQGWRQFIDGIDASFQTMCRAAD